jgi:hypothetical protein
MMSTITLVQDPPPPEEPPKPEIAADDPRYFTLSEPIEVAGKTFDRLLIDTSALSGPAYFNIINRYQREYPTEFRNMVTEYNDRIFLWYLAAELNPPMVIEDLQKLWFGDLPGLVGAVSNFLLAERLARLAKKKALRAGTL